MPAPIITLDSAYPGLMALTIRDAHNVPVTVRLTLREAEQFALDVASTTRSGFMQPAAIVGDFPELRDAIAERGTRR